MFFVCVAVWTTLQSHLKQTGELSKESLRCLTAGLKVEGKYFGIKMSSRLLAVVQEHKINFMVHQDCAWITVHLLQIHIILQWLLLCSYLLYVYGQMPSYSELRYWDMQEVTPWIIALCSTAYLTGCNHMTPSCMNKLCIYVFVPGYKNIFSFIFAACPTRKLTTPLKIKRNLTSHFQLILLLKELTRQEGGRLFLLCLQITKCLFPFLSTELMFYFPGFTLCWWFQQLCLINRLSRILLSMDWFLLRELIYFSVTVQDTPLWYLK